MNAHEALTLAAEICRQEVKNGGTDHGVSARAVFVRIIALHDSLGEAQPAIEPHALVRWLKCWWENGNDWRAAERFKYSVDVAHLLRGVADMIEGRQTLPLSETPQGERAKDAIREANCILNADMPCSRRQELEAELAALRAGANVPEGWKLVPVAIDEKMIQAFGYYFFSEDWGDSEPSIRREATEGWAILLAAAPSAKGEG